MTVKVTPDRSVSRLGSIQPRPMPTYRRKGRYCPCDALASSDDGAVEKTRTSTAFRPQRPQRCASTSSATTARHEKSRRQMSRHWQGAAPSKGSEAAQCRVSGAAIRSITGQSLKRYLPFRPSALACRHGPLRRRQRLPPRRLGAGRRRRRPPRRSGSRGCPPQARRHRQTRCAGSSRRP